MKEGKLFTGEIIETFFFFVRLFPGENYEKLEDDSGKNTAGG